VQKLKVGLGLNLHLKSLFFPQSPPHERIQARTQSIVNRPENLFW